MNNSIIYTGDGDLVFHFKDRTEVVKGKFPLVSSTNEYMPFFIKSLHKTGTDGCLWFNENRVASLQTNEHMQISYRKAKKLMRKLKMKALGI